MRSSVLFKHLGYPLRNARQCKISRRRALLVQTKEHMPEIKKIDAKIAVESKLADVTKALAALDKLTTRAELLELELSQLRAQEAEILKDETKSDESKLPNLLGVRGKIDLKSAADALHSAEHLAPGITSPPSRVKSISRPKKSSESVKSSRNYSKRGTIRTC